MKKVILSILLFLLSVFSKGQSYIPMLDSYSEWHITGCYTGCTTDFYYTIGDTTIDGMDFKFLDLYHFMRNFVLREDTAQRKIYMRFLGPSAQPRDILLYDFKLKVGDTAYVANPNSPYPSYAGGFILDSIMSRPLVTKNYRYFYLHSLDTATSHVKNTIWVEGIGSLCLINTPGAPPDIMGVGQLSCFFHNGIKEYENLDSISSCQSVYPILVKENEKIGRIITISPNPANEIISIRSNKDDFEGQKIEIQSAYGKNEMIIEYHGSINISLLSSGLYFIHFIKEGQSFVMKFAKE
jgi:hypothetical protein